MKVQFKVSDAIIIEAEGDNPKEVFAQLAEMQEVFQHSGCGMCKNKNIRFVVRTADKYEYPEMRCMKCGARLSFGNQEGGKMYPKRTWNSLADEKKSDERKNRAHQKQYADEHYGQLPDKGWYKWKPADNNDES
jgi:hypothetical protein